MEVAGDKAAGLEGMVSRIRQGSEARAHGASRSHQGERRYPSPQTGSPMTSAQTSTFAWQTCTLAEGRRWMPLKACSRELPTDPER